VSSSPQINNQKGFAELADYFRRLDKGLPFARVNVEGIFIQFHKNNKIIITNPSINQIAV
jgi:hypothetical protein